ncbi:fumarylacetoacetate hydrolase family protein [Pseudolysinimonas yzui]|uniref:2-hydroxyhepta-2,4-diene-1,7-dioate isomerase n=1 Tax=Pseudolysinimonas yzui TaxID=2708254 RepID=A0A8J3M6R6_9MICO|nr:fumarylacetoacetate hydrolase family protein [Pseudolysinimonas yzui]GHF27461.1 2-hydroxyhepta-2,4-diene-1,7-dioate isomerase [Pseudolysinimonas yzui]
MRLATLRRGGTTIPVRVEREYAVRITGVVDIGELLRDPGWRARASVSTGPEIPLHSVADEEWAPPVAPSKIVCVGLNYRAHIREMGRTPPEFPTLFAKFPEAVIGPYDPLRLPPAAPDMVDWEAEVAVVVGPQSTIAGLTLINDVTARDFQNRTTQWLQGKTFEKTAPLGPVIVTPDEFSTAAVVRCRIGSELVQEGGIDDLVFDPAALVGYISQIVTLKPGDVIATGTPSGVGHARTPPRYLRAGDTLVTESDGIGAMRNLIVAA